jgi:putative glutathione S-transferase
MGHLLNGAWVTDETLTEDRGGRYVKQPSKFRNWITADGSSGFPAEPGRYHLYSAVGCPWAHRTEIFRVLKKLEGIIGLTGTRQRDGGQGWSFEPEGHVVPGTDHRALYLHELYTLSDPGCTARVTVPTLWDTETRQIVSNESSEIIRMFNSAFAAVAPETPDYYPADLADEIDAVNALVLDGVNNAINECGRSTSQEAYEAASDRLFATLDRLDARLEGQRYLCGNRQTEADWRLYPSLIRFDSIYVIGYKCSQRRIEDYPNLSNYLRDLYQTPGISGVSDVDGMKLAIFGGFGPVPSNGLVPKGPILDLDRPHDRARFA